MARRIRIIATLWNDTSDYRSVEESLGVDIVELNISTLDTSLRLLQRDIERKFLHVDTFSDKMRELGEIPF